MLHQVGVSFDLAVFYILSDVTSKMFYYTGGGVYRRKLPFFGKTFLMLICIDIAVRSYTCLISCSIPTVCNHSTSDTEFIECSPELRHISHEAPLYSVGGGASGECREQERNYATDLTDLVFFYMHFLNYKEEF